MPLASFRFDGCVIQLCLSLLLVGSSGAAAAAPSSTELDCASYKEGQVSNISIRVEAVAASLLSYTGGWLSPNNFSLANFSYSGGNSSRASFLLLHPTTGRPACSCVCDESPALALLTHASCRLSCIAFSPPRPPWPPFDGCRWHLTGNGLLFEVDAANSSLACLNPSAVSARPPSFSTLGWTGSVTPGQANVLFNKLQYILAQTFNSKLYIGHVSDMIINELWPVRVSLIGKSANQSELRYRPYLGWSESCLHDCRAVYATGSVYRTVRQECYRVSPPAEMAASDHSNSSRCAWTFAVDCSPIRVRWSNRSQPCPAGDAETTTAAEPVTTTAAPSPHQPTVSSTVGSFTNASATSWPHKSVESAAAAARPLSSLLSCCILALSFLGTL